MSGTDTRLRELLEIAAGEPPSTVSVAAVRRLARRRRTLRTTIAAASAAVACAAVSIAAAGASGLVSGRPSTPRLSAAGVPQFYVQQGPPAANGFVSVSRRAVVRDTATGAVTATVSCPWAGAAISGDIAAADGETFFMACLQSGGSGRHPTVIGSRIYRFRITGAGTVDSYSLVAGAVLPGRAVEGLAAAADGSAIAMWSFHSLLFDSGTVLVVNTRTGARASWRPTTPGISAQDLSLSPTGRELRFLIFTGHPQTWVLAQVTQANRGGSLGRARVLVHVPASQLISYARLSPDGSLLTVGWASAQPRAANGEVSIEQISVRTGKVIRVLFRAAVPASGIAGYRKGSEPVGFGDRVSSDPSGRYFIVIYGNPTGMHNGWLRRGRLVPLTPAVAPAGLYETW